MKSQMQIENPDDVEVTLTLTMPLGAWVKLSGQLTGVVYPANRVRDEINNLVRQMNARLHPTLPDDLEAS